MQYWLSRLYLLVTSEHKQVVTFCKHVTFPIYLPLAALALALPFPAAALALPLPVAQVM